MASKIKVNYFLPILIGLIISFIFCGGLVILLNRIDSKKIDKFYLNELIKSNINKNDRKTYLTIKTISPKIATNGKDNGYYIVSDNEYNYVVLLSDQKAKELMSIDLDNNPVTINGISKDMNKELKKIVLENYNSTREENEKISLKEYYSYFGDVYLDQTLALK